jgi:hypothetical protein
MREKQNVVKDPPQEERLERVVAETKKPNVKHPPQEERLERVVVETKKPDVKHPPQEERLERVAKTKKPDVKDHAQAERLERVARLKELKDDLLQETSYIRAAAGVLICKFIDQYTCLLVQRYPDWSVVANGRSPVDRGLLADAVYVLFQLSANHTSQPIDRIFFANYHRFSMLGDKARDLLDSVGLKVSFL